MYEYELECGKGPFFKSCASIRTAVFMEEQGFCREFDEIDDTAWHLLLRDGDKPVATGRVYSSGQDVVTIGRVAVVREYRGCGAGRAVLQALEEFARGRGVKEIKLSAQVQAEGFYRGLGYRASGEEYLDEHCPHIEMHKLL
jgi:predicted GNAT family N-acyltransferase